MRRSLLLAISFLWAGIAQGAPPLVPGQLLVTGADYPGHSSSCPVALCRFDPATETTTVLGPSPGNFMAIESPTTILGVSGYGQPSSSIVRVDVTTGAVTTVAPAVAQLGALTVGPTGRIFVFQWGVGVSEVDRWTGALRFVTSGGSTWNALAAEPSGTLLTAEFDDAPPWFFTHFVRIDPDTGVTTPLAEIAGLSEVTRISVGAGGDRFLYGRDPIGEFGLIHWISSSSSQFLGSTDRDATSDAAGTLWVPRTDYGAGPVGTVELQHLTATGALIADYDLDYIVSEVEIVPYFQNACANGIDDDGDGHTDHPADIGCRDAAGGNENPRCDDGADNDGDGGVDWDGAGLGAPDAQCAATPWRDRETSGGCGLGGEIAFALAILRRLVRRA